MLVWVAILLFSHLMCFSPLEKPLFCILDSFWTEYRQIPLLSIFMGLTLTASEQIGRSIEPKSCALCLLNTSSADSQSIEVAFFSINSRNLLDWSRYPCLDFIFFFFAFFFFSFVSIASCFSFSCRSRVRCSPRSLYISFLSISGHFFFFGSFMPFDNRVKKGENFENWISFLRGRISC